MNLRIPFLPRPPVVPVLRLSGVIGMVGLRGGLSLASLERSIEALFRRKEAPAVALVVNSPGGSPVQSSLIAGRIRALAAEKRKPVIAFVEDVAASGGYWLALAADEILVDPSSIIGSIGVVSAGFGFTDAIARLGVERRVHTTGARKALLDPFRPENPDDLGLLRELQDDIYQRFVAWVRERRGERLRPGGTELFDGRVFTGERAVGLGLVDGLGDLRTTMKARFGEKTRLQLIGPRQGWLQRRLRLDSRPAHMVADMLSVLEERAHWQRLGL